MKILTYLFLSFSVYAKTEVYIGKASSDGKNLYTETHTVEVGDEDGQVKKAVTEYKTSDDTLISKLESDFTTSLTAPAHTTTDFRINTVYGLRYLDSNKMEMFDKDGEEAEKTKTLEEGFVGKRLVIASQGLHYYMKDRLEELKEKKKLAIAILIPGKLSHYDFELEFVKEKDGQVEFEVHIQNRFLRFFAPDLFVRYDLKTKRLLYYRGLSNILDEKGDNQNVEISYEYP